MGFSPALYDYITKYLKKSIVLVLNKVDLAPPPLVVAWQHYFKEKFPLVDVVCFTSFPKDENELAAGSGSRGWYGDEKAYLSQNMKLLYLSHYQETMAQASLYNDADSSEPSLLTGL